MLDSCVAVCVLLFVAGGKAYFHVVWGLIEPCAREVISSLLLNFYFMVWLLGSVIYLVLYGVNLLWNFTISVL